MSEPFIIAELPLKRGAIIRIHLELYRGKWAFHVRKWYPDEHSELCPGKVFRAALNISKRFGLRLDHATTIAPLAGVGIDGGSA